MNDPDATPDHHTDARSLGSQERLARKAIEGIPSTIGRFEIRRLLGEGAYGVVYLAFDPNLHREVALKVPVGLTPAAREEFLREARAAAGIHHPNVCQVFEAGTAGNVPFIVSRYIAGGTLVDVLKRANGALPPDIAIEIVRKIALGLAAAHAKGIIHRDLKPGNVLFDEENNEVLITDFGLAKLLTHANQSSGGMKGTPTYMSPEQFGDGRKAGDVGRLADVYSLGVVFYELLTGQLPFMGDTPLAMMQAHIQDTPGLPSACRRDLDPRLDVLCLKALEKKPADRYASAKDFANVLADYLRNKASVPAPPLPAPPRETISVELRAKAEADYQRGNDYFFGRGRPQDLARAREWWEKAAAQGNAGAQCNLGLLYANGRGVPQDLARAREWYEKAAAQGHVDAQGGLGMMYANGDGVPQDHAQAREWWEKAAAQGDGRAQFNLGLMYANGHGVPQDNSKAREWYAQAAAQGDVRAQFNLGFLYCDGQGMPQDYVKAREWWEQAAAQGDIGAQSKLGILYVNGYGVSQDYAKACEWFEKAAAQGDAHAQFNLGLLYCNGHGVPQDYAKTRELYEKAADQGNADAKCNLGVLYYKGQGVPQEYAKAREWWEKAAAQGHSHAQCNLAELHENGKGVTKDMTKSLALYRQSAAQGNEYAKEALKRLGEKA